MLENEKPQVTLRKKYGIPELSDAWDGVPGKPIIRFWTTQGDCFGVPFTKILSILYEDQTKKLTVHIEKGAFLIDGPKVLDLFNLLAAHQTAAVKGTNNNTP